MNKKWWKAAGIRALKTFAQTLGSMIPVGIVVGPEMVQNLDWSVLYIILAWLATGVIAGVASLLTSLAGLPELENEEEE